MSIASEYAKLDRVIATRKEPPVSANDVHGEIELEFRLANKLKRRYTGLSKSEKNAATKG